MSKIAILSDIHGNLPAFKAVLREIQQSRATSVVFLGDIVGYGASPAQCVALVRKLGGHSVMGNHDEVIEAVRKPGFAFRDRAWKKCGYQAGLAHAAKDLDDDQAAWLAALPYTTTLPGAVAAHGSLDRPMAFNYIQDAGSALPTLELLRERDTEGWSASSATPTKPVFSQTVTRCWNGGTTAGFRSRPASLARSQSARWVSHAIRPIAAPAGCSGTRMSALRSSARPITAGSGPHKTSSKPGYPWSPPAGC
jgi:hypothetical protein